MRNIFIGLILVLFNFYLTSGSGSLNLLPNFIGYAFVLKGVLELAIYNPKMLQLKNVLYALIVVSAVDFVTDFMGFGEEILGYGLEAIGMVLHFFMLYKIIEGIREIQARFNFDLFADNLMVWWKVNVIISGISFVGGIFIPLIAIANVVISVLFIIQIHKTNKQWDRYWHNPINIGR